MDQLRGNAITIAYAWINFVHQLFDKQGFTLVVMVWLGIATVLVPNKTRPARDFGIALFVIAAVFAVSWLLPSGEQSYFYRYDQGSFRLAIPGDLRTSEQTAEGTVFRGSQPNRSLLLDTGELPGDAAAWLQRHYSQDVEYASKQNVIQPLAPDPAYIFPNPRRGHQWSQDADYYVVSWDDKNGIDYYKTVVVFQEHGKSRWGMFEYVSPLSPTPPVCTNGTTYMLDTFLVSAGLKFVARDPQCPHHV